MKKTSNAIMNLLYSVASLIYFLMQNGIIVFPGTTEKNGYKTVFTEGYLTFMTVASIVLAAVGIVVIVYDFLLQKKCARLTKAGLIIAICASAFTAACLLILGNAPITCVLGIVAAVLIFIPGKQEGLAVSTKS